MSRWCAIGRGGELKHAGKVAISTWPKGPFRRVEVIGHFSKRLLDQTCMNALCPLKSDVQDVVFWLLELVKQLARYLTVMFMINRAHDRAPDNAHGAPEF